MNMSPMAYSYIRFSTPEQIKGDSLRRQTELSEQYAKKHGFVLDDSLKLQDLGLSAFSGEHKGSRGALGQFLKLVEDGKIEKGSVLLVENFDRLSRQEITKALQQFLDIINRGIKIVTLIDNREYTEETVNANVGELIVSLTIMARAHEESATKSKRLKAAWEVKRKHIASIKLTNRCPAWLKLNEAKTQYDIIEDHKVTICRIFDMKIAGKGIGSIVRELNSTPGIWKPGSNNKRKQGEGWRESYVGKILKNRSVIGEFQPHRLLKGKREPIGEPISNYFPKVIERDIFFRVQEQIKSNIHKGGRNGNINSLFGHIAKCGYCGSSLAFVNKGSSPKGGQYLICDRARRGFECCHASVKYGEFEHYILTYCKGLRPQDFISENDETGINLLKNECDGKIGELNSLNGEIDNIVDSISITKDQRNRKELDKRLTEKFDKQAFLKQSIDQLKLQIDKSSRCFEDTKLSIDSLKELLAFLKTDKTNQHIDLRLKLRNEIRKLVTKIEVYPEGLRSHLSQTSKTSQGCFKLFFTSGSMRQICPQKELPIERDYDKEDGTLRIWYTFPSNRVICKTILEDGSIRRRKVA